MTPEALSFINSVLGILMILIVMRGILSWLDPFERTQTQQILATLTEPLIAPFRLIIPPLGGVIDISWWMAVLAIVVIARLINQLAV
jgi:YggT family protein